jgi:SAM-dependent methyltransferase
MHTNAINAWEQHIAPLVKTGMGVLEVSPRGRYYYKRLRGMGITPDFWVCNPDSPDDNLPYKLVGMPGEYQIHCPDESFDCTWSSSVLEHVRRPWLWMEKMARLVKPGGFIGVISPITWEEHRVRGPGGHCDAWRIMPDGMRTIMEDAGLVPETVVCVMAKNDTEREMKSNRGFAIDLASVGRKPL